MRRSIIDRIGGQRPLAHTHDMEMWLRIAAYADVAYVNGAYEAWHREHAASLSKKAEDRLVILTEIRRCSPRAIRGREPRRSRRRAAAPTGASRSCPPGNRICTS